VIGPVPDHRRCLVVAIETSPCPCECAGLDVEGVDPTARADPTGEEARILAVARGGIDDVAAAA